MKNESGFKIGIIGGYGKMGRWLAAFLRDEGKDVIIAGRDPDKLKKAAKELKVKAVSNKQAVRRSDAVILSVPIDSFEEVVQEIAPFTHDRQFIFDVTSIKSKPVKTMHQYIRKGIILGTHPMFGPGAAGIKGQRFVLTPTKKQEVLLAEKVRGYLEEREARVEVMTPQQHDELMGIVLGLAHFIALVSADTLAALNRMKEAQKVSGTTYRMLLKMSEAVLSEDPSFYSSLQVNLPGLPAAQKLFIRKADEWASLVKHGKRGEFIQRMKSLKEAFAKDDPGFTSAYKDMYRLIED